MDEDVTGDEPEEVGECEQCGQPICEGEEVREVADGTYVHDDCLADWAREHFDLVIVGE